MNIFTRYKYNNFYIKIYWVCLLINPGTGRQKDAYYKPAVDVLSSYLQKSGIL